MQISKENFTEGGHHLLSLEQRLFFTDFSKWINYVILAFPLKLRPTFLELLFGVLIASSGHVTDALLAITFANQWASYYKAIEYGSFHCRHIIKHWIALCLTLLEGETLTMALDDTQVLRSSQKAPGVDTHFDHAPKANQKSYVSSQLFVSLFFIASTKVRSFALPIWFQLMSKDGNRSKLHTAKILVLSVARFLKNSKKIRLLVDAWYMKASLILPLLECGIHIIGQIRKDSALFLPPLPKTGAGRPRKYGPKLPFNLVSQLFEKQVASIFAYGKEQTFEFYIFNAQVRFLKGLICRMVWCRFRTESSTFTPWRLLLSTDLSLTAAQIISSYASRWSVETAFNVIKNVFGLSQAWEQSKKAFARWRCILCLAYGLCALASFFWGECLKKFSPIPWRKNHPMTASWVVKILARIFRYFPIRSCWDRKSQKFVLPESFFEPFLQKTG
jgi:hypothetical protein